MKNKIIAYVVVKASDTEEIGREVRNAISVGWQPLGGVTYCGNWFYQVIVKYAERVEK